MVSQGVRLGMEGKVMGYRVPKVVPFYPPARTPLQMQRDAFEVASALCISMKLGRLVHAALVEARQMQTMEVVMFGAKVAHTLKGMQ